ncbi:hypothetical protein LTS18_013353 [Coniosporium uncinatum]|uniref:Uncharacterized protein n=1 Tax=Coniosporium uncinatum TaxID=93489 RepID=A0ACC3CWJ2_9PEZI|nr:hypothetical protein LTS18_013353 [Coniosporium uncinatum]
MRSSTFFVALSAAAAVQAQTAAQSASAAAIAATIPDCVRPCDDAAIAQVGCPLEDQACHCAHGAQLSKILPPCLLQNSTCTPAELQFFGTLPPKICAALGLGNATAPVAGANATAGAGAGTGNVSATATPTGSSSPAAYTGAAAVSGVATGLFAVVGAGLVGLML